MKNIAMIQSGVVVNVAVWDGVSPWNPPGFTLVDITNQPLVGIGWTYDGTFFTPPSS